MADPDSSDSLALVHVYEPGEAGEPGEGRTLLLLHGTGGDENDLLPLGRMVAPGAARLSPRGRVLERGAPRWFRRLAEGVFDEADVVARANELADFVEAAADAYGFAPESLIAVGFSNGANIAAAVLLLRPGVLSAAALLAPMVPLRPEAPVDLAGTRVLIGAGRRDPIAPPEQAEALARLLADSGAEVDLSWHEGGHQLDRTTLAALRDWLG
jgi:predicted esterase